MTDMRNLLKTLASFVRGLLFVRTCIGCGTKIGADAASPLCGDCLAAYLQAREYACPSCGERIALCRCSVLDGGTLPLYSFLPYRPRRSESADAHGQADIVSEILLSRKDRLNPDTEAFLAGQMAALCECVIAEHAGSTDRSDWVLTYPPRSQRKRREVGHDQSEELALRTAALTGLSLYPCLLRVRHADTAQKLLDAEARAENARSSYTLSPDYRDMLRGRSVMMIDDIATTGATLAACASLLREAGAANVAALTAAKTVHGDCADRAHGR